MIIHCLGRTSLLSASKTSSNSDVIVIGSKYGVGLTCQKHFAMLYGIARESYARIIERGLLYPGRVSRPSIIR